MDNFSKKMAEIMRNRKITQTALADLTGISQAAISRYVKGLASPGAKELYILSRVFEISMESLWTGDEYTELDKQSSKNLSYNEKKSAAEEELAELKHALRVVFRAMSEPEGGVSGSNK